MPSPVAVNAPNGGLDPTTNQQPNVLLVTIDTLRADRIGPYGFSQAHTPVLDQLAREGVRFDHAICQLPQTDPSHAALMTGLYASTSGVKVHMVDKIRPDTQTAASIFQSAGYQTAGFYSWVSLDPQFCGLNQGFQTYEGYVINRGAVFGNPLLEQIAASYRQLKAEVPIVKTADLAIGASSDYEQTLDGRADVTNQAVFAWLDAHARQGPFFLWVHYFDPHYPYAPPTGYDHILGLDYQGSINGSVTTIQQIEAGKLTPSPADTARLEELYQGEIAFTDAQLGRLLDYLAQLGIKDNTIITVTGDHGESFGEHGDWTHGLKVFETEIRVPLLMRYPGHLPAGVNVTAPAQLIDVLPTFLELTGLTVKQPIQGTSLLPVMKQDANGTSRIAFTELADEAFVSVLTWGDWKMIRNNANGQLQLYNLNQDEGEQQNLLAADPKTAAEMSARLQDLMKISGVSK
ncbi:MAG TPA: sulfatase [Chloroflexota bacterium]|nr:sulfatase [Chloroflexota bacterium]